MTDLLIVPRFNRKHLRRLFSKIAVDDRTGCWLWTGALNTGGYAQTSVNNIRTTIHRVMYAWLVHPIPTRLGRAIPQLDHLCDTRRCVNPVHLKIVTARENNLRGKGKGALYATRTHCKNGHELPDPRSTPGDVQPRRRCRLCKRDARQRELHRLAERAYRARQKLKAHSTTQQNEADLSPPNTYQG